MTAARFPQRASGAGQSPAGTADRGAPRLSGRIFRSVLAFSLIGIVAFSLILTAIFYSSLERDASRTLLIEAHRAAAYLDEVPPSQRTAVLGEQFNGKVRFTLISPEGEVLFDSAAPASDNHGDRPEIREALEKGEGATSRYSTTLHTDTIYAAAPLSDGVVVRLAETRESLMALLLNNLLVPVVAALLVAVALVLVLSRMLTRSLMRPLDDLGVSKPLHAPTYAEMQPFLARIDSQQRTLRAQNEELAQAESMRRDFSANVSHEMKTPLQVISGYAELMENGLVPPEDVPRFAGLIHQESQTMRALIDDVLTLSRLDEVPPDTAAVPVDVFAVARRVAERLQKLAEERSVSVSVEGVSARILGSESLVEQILYNLVENAIRYNNEGGCVFVEVSSDGEEAVVRVSDTGPGVPPEAREKVFERFYRLEKSRSKETGGTGLGLAIVKHGVQRLGGTVNLAASPQDGAEFTLCFPAIQN